MLITILAHLSIGIQMRVVQYWYKQYLQNVQLWSIAIQVLYNSIYYNVIF